MSKSASCLCGSVRLQLPDDLGPATACHCSQCRKYSGHHAASFDVASVTYLSDATLTWFTHPSGAKRGFCNVCGSSMVFTYTDGGQSVEAGAIDGPTDERLTDHIFVADKGDYYTLNDGLPQAEQY